MTCLDLTRLVIDVESTSVLDLRKVGAARYWAHPETHVICVAYKVDSATVQVWRPGEPAPDIVWSGRDYRIVAHNYLFEWHCWEQKLHPLYGWPKPRASVREFKEEPKYWYWDDRLNQHTLVSKWNCTMARSLYWGLPPALGDVTAALNLSHQKDKAGEAIMKRMARPRYTDPLIWWHETDPEKLQKLIDYCVKDVEAEAALDDALPPLPDRERQIFQLDGEINRRGIRVDRDLVLRLGGIAREEIGRLSGEMRRLTDGRVSSVNQVGEIGKELREQHGVDAPSLGKKEIEHLLTLSIGGAPRAILETRLEAAKSSTAKLKLMDLSADDDDRCRGLFQYLGAARTGRWAGRRIQPQNFPREGFKNPDEIIALIKAGITARELGRLLDRSVMDACAALLRPCLTAAPGHLLVAGDLAQIEARVVAWLAGQEDMLDVFRTGEDVYTHTARSIGSDSRLLGKVLVLACGFGMGPRKFKDTAEVYKLFIPLEDAEQYVAAWREQNTKIVTFWWDIHNAANRVIQASDGYSETVRRVTLRKTKQAMRIVLPSGRELTYQQTESTQNEKGRFEPSYMGIGLNKKWQRIRTYGGRLVENITQAVARDVMAETMLRLHQVTVPIVGTVHDELVAEVKELRAPGLLNYMLGVMRTTPSWAPGLPVYAEGWVGQRYRKG